MRLSIIIPCYNAEPYISELLDRLLEQVNKDIEIIVIDDGSRKPFKDDRVKVIRKENGGVSSARNLGLDKAKGDYIAFIDADDMVSKDFIKQILDKLEKEPDVIWLSWETFGGGWNQRVILHEGDNFPSWNLCVWNRVYKRDLIGDIRFNEKKKVAEDAEFIRDVKVKNIAYISKPIYFYRTNQHNSLTQRVAKGLVDTHRIVYYFDKVTKAKAYIIDEIKEVYEDCEVIVITNKNELPELEDYALVMKPAIVYGHELRGDATNLFRQIPKPIKTQVVIYIGSAQEIGGVETWMYNFSAAFHKKYDIMICYSERMYPAQIERLSRFVMVHKLGTRPIFCDTLLNMRITDKIPESIQAKQIIQVCHTCKMLDWKIQKEYDKLVYVSQTAADTFEEEGLAIHNLTYNEEFKKPLLLVSASRFSFEKGMERMYKLANAFKNKGIDILWLVFTNKEIEEINGIKRMVPTMNMRAWISKADYLVQLSDMESYCYSIVEALELGVPVITTPITVLKELGFKDKRDGYIVPFDMKGIDVEEIYSKIPKPEYDNGNEKIKKQWVKLLGNTKPNGTYNTDKPFLKVRALEYYGDLELGRDVKQGEELMMRRARATLLLNLGKVEIVEE